MGERNMRLIRIVLVAGLALHPVIATAQTGTIVVANKSANTASVIDVATGRTLATLPTGQTPHEAAISSDGRVAVITDYGARGNSLTVIDIPGLRVARTVPMGQYLGPHGIAFLPGDSLLAVTTERSGHVVIVRVDGTVVKAISTVEGGSHMLAVIGSGGRIYTSNMRDNSVAELDVAAGNRTRVYSVPPRPEAITVTRAGDQVWVGSNDRGTVSVVNTATGESREVLTGFRWPYRILIAPDNRLVLLPDLTNEDLRFVDRTTYVEHARLSFPGGGPQGITFNTDASLVFLSLSAEDRIAVIDVAARSVRRYLPAGDSPDGIVYSRLVIGSPN